MKYFDNEEEAKRLYSGYRKRSLHHLVHGRGPNPYGSISMALADNMRKQFGSERGNELICEVHGEKV